MPRLERITVSLKLPVVGEIAGTWAPDDAEREAAWEMYVELATRVTLIPLAPDNGILREALTSFYSLFGTTRQILREHGPRVARPAREGDLSFAAIALAVLNGAIRPLLTRWHPELTAYEQQRPTDRTVIAWERSWPSADHLRQELETSREVLLDYADLLAKVSDVSPLHFSQNPDQS